MIQSIHSTHPYFARHCVHYRGPQGSQPVGCAAIGVPRHIQIQMSPETFRVIVCADLTRQVTTSRA